MAIVDLPEFQDYIRDEGNGLGAPTLQSFLDAAIEGFANATKRYLTLVDVDTVATDWSFYPDSSSSSLRIPDATSVTSITQNGVTIAAVNYRLEPVNATSLTGEFRPYEQVCHLYQWWYTPVNTPLVVTAKWGWSSFPRGMVEAIKVLGKELCNNQDVRYGIVGVADGVVSGIRQNKIVREAIATYARIETVGLA